MFIDANIFNKPALYEAIAARSEAIGFTMPSDLYIGTLLKTLVSSKKNGHFLELGTGTGLSLSWMVEGMDANASLISVDNDPQLTAIAREYFGHESRVALVCQDGTAWIRSYKGKNFDLIFADAWPGKYSELEEVLELLNPGGFYVIDDMKAQPNWPAGHQEKADELLEYLERRPDLHLTKMNWSTGLVVAVKREIGIE